MDPNTKIMSVRLNIERHTSPQSGYTKDVVQCPIKEGYVKATSCKQCEHCRIYAGDYVKCSYEKDIYKILHPHIHVYSI